MKLKTTNKAIRENAKNIISIGYCEAQYLLRGAEPFAYTCGVYGHNADFYKVGNAIISTGYRPIGTRKPYGVINEYEKKAAKIWNDERSYNIYGYEERKNDSNAILAEFVKA
jgi:hypothetical protein